MSEDEWEDFKIDYQPAYEAMQAQYAQLQQGGAQGQKPEPPIDPKYAELQQKVNSFEEEKRQQYVEGVANKVVEEATKLHTEAFAVVHEGLRELGLEPDTAKDDERTIALKAHTAKQILDGIDGEVDGPDGPEGDMDWSLCTPEQKENRQLAVKIMSLLSQQDFAAARDYLDVMKVRYDLAFQRVAKPAVELYNAAMLQPTNQPRSANGTRRPEIVNGSAGNGNVSAKTPWLEPGYKQPEESAFDAMNRYLDEHG
jgi:hypothetical protein